MKKLKQEHEYNWKSDIKHILSLKIQNLYAISKWYINYLLQKRWCHYYCIVFKDE